MNSSLLFSSVGKRFLRYKFKSFLLMLGVMVGVFVLTSGLALGSGFKTAVLDYFNKTFLPDSITLATSNNVPGARGISVSDIAAVLDAVPEIGAWTPLIPGGAINFSRHGVSQLAMLNGTSPDAQTVIGQTTATGEYFSAEDLRTRARVTLLGRTVAGRLFGAESPLGQPLEIGSQVFFIKGVLNPLGADPHGGDLDNVVVIPYTTLLQINKREELVNVRIKINNSAAVAGAAARIREVMRTQHNLGDGRQDDFYVATAPAGQASFQEFEAMFKVLLPVITGIIFGISLLVIASIMLIAVKERTAEIGLRKAVGARAQDVEFQFLAEITLLALVGGVLGILLSYPGLWYIQSLYARYGSEASFLPTLTILLLSLACAALTGVLAAWLPARRAAALSPVEALR